MAVDTLPSPSETSSNQEKLKKEFATVTDKLASQVSRGYVGYIPLRDWVETHIYLSTPVETHPHYIDPKFHQTYIEEKLTALQVQLQVLGRETEDTKIRERIQSGSSMKIEQEYFLFLHAKALVLFKGELEKPLPYNAFGPIRDDESDDIFEHARNQLKQIREKMAEIFSHVSKRK